MTTQVPSATDKSVAQPPILSHWIDGRPVEVLPEATGPVFNPATGEVIARVPRGGAPEVDAAVAAAKRAFPAWRDMPLIARSEIFFAFRERMWQHREELAALDHARPRQDLPGRPHGSPARPRDGRVRVRPAEPPGRREHPAVSTNVDAHTLRQPLGVVAGITPFNFPVMVPTWIYPIALMAGNTFILKPSIPHAGRHPAPGRAVEGSRPPGRRLQHRLRRPRSGRRHPGPSRHRGHPVRGLDGGRPARLRDRHPARQAGHGLHRRQERDGRPAGRGPGAGRRRGGRRGLRLGRRAVHGPDPDPRRGRRRPTGSGRSSRSGSATSRSAPASSPASTWARSTRPSTASRSSAGSRSRRQPKAPSWSSTDDPSIIRSTPMASSSG